MSTTIRHVLLRKAMTCDTRSVDLSPVGCVYDDRIGAWRISSSGELYVRSDNKKPPMTKKQDVETGEDQKGE